MNKKIISEQFARRLNISNEELISLHQKGILWHFTNPKGNINQNCLLRFKKDTTKSVVEQMVGASMLGPEPAKDMYTYYYPVNGLENIATRLYYLLIQQIEQNSSVKQERYDAYGYKLNITEDEYTFFDDHKKKYILFQRPEQELEYNIEVSSFLRQKNTLNVLDIGIGRSKRIVFLDQRLHALGPHHINTYGMNLTRLNETNAPCFVGRFETYDFQKLSFDLLYSVWGAAFYTQQPKLFLEKLVSIMNEGAIAWLHIDNRLFRTWHSMLNKVRDLKVKYLYPLEYVDPNGPEIIVIAKKHFKHYWLFLNKYVLPFHF
ncbi:hypothetical protein ACFL5G_00930 [Candidatus Margulisiibacteriota bacterium]